MSTAASAASSASRSSRCVGSTSSSAENIQLGAHFPACTGGSGWRYVGGSTRSARRLSNCINDSFRQAFLEPPQRFGQAERLADERLTGLELTRPHARRERPKSIR